MINNFSKIHKIIKNRKTLLGVGPMSLNTVDASIELSDQFKVPLILIASRRQIDSKKFGGGYVNNWTTEEFSKYVKKKQKTNNIFLARDHGGPWQNNNEVKKKLNTKDAIKSAKESFEVDIINDFGFIHIDTSIDIHKNINFKNSMERLFELYSHCFEFAKKNKKNILFEIGTEEQSGSTNNFRDLQITLDRLSDFCKKNNYPLPTFVVAQAGTKVMETKNIGSFESPVRIKNEIPVEIHLLKTLEICEKNKIYMKEHNADYLSTNSLKWHPRLGIHAANVAPEFGVCESKKLVEIFKDNNLKKELNAFIDISYSSKKWEKWIIDKNLISDFDKAIISGHYIFSDPKFIEIKKQAQSKLKNVNIDNILKKEIKNCIKRYLKSFELI